MLDYKQLLNNIQNQLSKVKSECEPDDSPMECEKEKLEDKLELEMLKENLKQVKSEEQNSETEMMEYKQDFYNMSVGSLTAVMQHAKSILDSLDNPMVSENLTAAHLQGMIAIVEDQMRSIHDFVMYVSQSADTSEGQSKPGLWENIRKKKEREGKKYKPAQPGDKDRPDPEQWKKLTK
jgi:hypothetical protein